ncbi:GDSL esterase/lipase At4g01130-like isoform X5 [Tasmannia lanceolata]|uniref:GDSL esterase/lipase At4g01130-like isoform X5 n=1 Tax=Tasmannia lanceolata TaxID=3420 RepID=UPI004062BF13
MGLRSSRFSAGFRRVFVMGICVLLIGMNGLPGEAKCDIKAIFNFGDSNSDTGGFVAAFPPQSSPYGMTYFHRPAGRASDGRDAIDFLAQAFGFPFLSPYLQSIGSNFMHGANFATSASTVLLPTTSLFVTGVSPFSLGIQLNQMKEFKAKVLELQSKGGMRILRISQSDLPQPDVFGRSLYTLDIGQNDFTGNLPYIGIEGVKQYLPQVVSGITETIKGSCMELKLVVGTEVELTITTQKFSVEIARLLMGLK